MIWVSIVTSCSAAKIEMFVKRRAIMSLNSAIYKSSTWKFEARWGSSRLLYYVPSDWWFSRVSLVLERERLSHSKHRVRRVCRIENSRALRVSVGRRPGRNLETIPWSSRRYVLGGTKSRQRRSDRRIREVMNRVKRIRMLLGQLRSEFSLQCGRDYWRKRD